MVCTRWPHSAELPGLSGGKRNTLAKSYHFPETRPTSQLYELLFRHIHCSRSSACLTSNSFNKIILKKHYKIQYHSKNKGGGGNRQIQMWKCERALLKVCCNLKWLWGSCTAPVARLQQCTCTWLCLTPDPEFLSLPLWDSGRAEHMLHVCAAAWDKQKYVEFSCRSYCLGWAQVWAAVSFATLTNTASVISSVSC